MALEVVRRDSVDSVGASTYDRLDQPFSLLRVLARLTV